MKVRLGILSGVVLGAAAGYLAVGAWSACAQEVPAGRERDQLPEPVYKVANKTAETSEAGVLATPAEHPLAPAIRLAKLSLDHIQADIKDYTATMVKRERIAGTLNDPESMFIKVRHQPFSVYMRFTAPKRIEGQEAIYVAGKRDGKLIGHGVGLRKLVGSLELEPNGTMAMQGQRYPITELGVLNLTKRLVEVAERDSKFGECDVKFFPEAKINGRLCTGIEVIHPVRRKEFLFNIARIFVDKQLNVPVRYQAFEWPTRSGGPPELLEEYTYLNIQVNVGLTDADFDDKNPKYNFH